MKIDRRSFLSFVIGGAAGTALSPLPWKLTDDMAIWSQMWPWTPVPERGEVTSVVSACTLCPGGCGISVRKVDQRVVKIEGLAGHPVNDGGLCALGLAGGQLLYGPRRVQTPLKKVNGSFRPITWDVALAEVANNLAELRKKGQAHRVACIVDRDRGSVPELLNRFLTVYGSPNFFYDPTFLDNYELALYLMQGVRAVPGFDAQNSDFVLSFGSGLLEGWGSPVFMFKAHSHWRESGGKLVQIEARLSKTAAKADRWIPVAPGTESVLALGMANVMLNESLYDRDFIDNYTSGFDTWKRQVIDGYSPEIVAKITGVEAAATIGLAREFARAGRPLALCGRGKGLTPGSLKEFMAVQALNALVGNFGRPGGFWTLPTPEYTDWPEPEMDAMASTGIQQVRIDGAGSSRYPHSRCLLNRLPEVVNSAAEPPIQMLFVSAANPCYSAPDSQAFSEAVQKIPMVVSFSSYMDETAEAADLILPNHTYLERIEEIPVTAGFNRPLINLVRPAVEPLFDTRHTGDVVLQLSQALGGSIAAAFPWDTYSACLEETLGDRLGPLLKNGFWMNTDYDPTEWATTFETESSKFEFVNADIDSAVLLSPIKAEGDETAFPLLLVPYDSMRLWNGYIGDPQHVIKSVPDTILKGNDVLVELNPDTGKTLGLKNGGQALLATPKGEGRVRIHYSEGIQPGLVALPRGLGHRAYEKNLAGKGINFNALIAPVEDAATGYDAAWGIRAKLTRI